MTLSIVVPALNEANNLEATVRSLNEIVPQYFKNWEILIFNDGSTDATGSIADRLAKMDPKVKVTHHSTPRNLGACYKEGVAQATKEFIIMVPGDNECAQDVLRPVFEAAGKADMVVPYTTNSHVRPLGRRILSRAFVETLNLLAHRKIRYYNGAVLHKTAIIRDCPIQTDGFGYQAEALVKLLRRGISFVEVPTEILYRPHGKSKALGPKNILSTVQFVLTLARESLLQRSN